MKIKIPSSLRLRNLFYNRKFNITISLIISFRSDISFCSVTSFLLNISWIITDIRFTIVSVSLNQGFLDADSNGNTLKPKNKEKKP